MTDLQLTVELARKGMDKQAAIPRLTRALCFGVARMDDTSKCLDIVNEEGANR